MAAKFSTLVMRNRALMRNGALAMLAASLCACGSVLLPAKAPAAALVAPPSESVADAERKLTQVASERAATEARYAAAEQVCYARFFVNNCLDAAKEERRSSLAVLRAIEIEAGRFKRRAVVTERDRALAQAEQEFAAQEARQAEASPKAPARPDNADAPRPPARARERSAARPARTAAPEAGGAEAQLDAARRAANVAAFEKNRSESERRQRTVAARKAERAAKAAREAAAREAAAREAAAKEAAAKAAAAAR
jgi:colicin import membrane protein